MKYIALASSALCFALLLSACSTFQLAPSVARTPSSAPAPAPDQPIEITVSAAASLVDALKEIQANFEATNKNIKLKINLGSSGALEAQIEQGAPVDLFVSASTTFVDTLVKKGLVDQSNVKSLVTNKLVLVRGKSAGVVVNSWADLTSDKVKKIAVGDPAHVPAGQYGKEVLAKLNLWSAVQDRLVLGSDVRQVLNYVESGDVEAGIVYSTDAATSKEVIVIAEAPDGSFKPVIYPVAVIKNSKNFAQAKLFADYLAGKGVEILKKYGFGVAQ